MKRKTLLSVLIVPFLFIVSLSANAQIKAVYHGKWSFNAPSAPEGYNYRTIEIKKDTVNTSFADPNYKLPSIWIKVKNDSIFYKTIVEGTEVLFSLKVENEASIKGNAVWIDGNTQIILKKKTD